MGSAPDNADRRYYDDLWREASREENRFERWRREAVVDAIDGLGRRELDILDLGCGRGLLAPHLMAFGRLTGIDWSEQSIAQCRRCWPDAHWKCGSFFEVELPDAAFDLVVSQEVIEHVPRKQQPAYLEVVHRVLRPGGTLVMTTPNRPVMDQHNRWHERHRGQPWSAQPEENLLSSRQVRSMVAGAKMRVRLCRSFIFGYARSPLRALASSWRLRRFPLVGDRLAQLADAGLHLLLVAEKPAHGPA